MGVERTSAARPRPEDAAAAWSATFFDELVRAGVAHAVVCPGSRSTPLALAAVGTPGLEVHVRLDERSAAFTALGIGLATGVPAVVVVTSGTAAAELHAAVVEADLARVPLIVVTADRPPELRDAGAPQTVDQVRLYGPAVRWFHDPGVPDPATRPVWRSLAARVAASALGGGPASAGPGPVHVNVPFREPLVGRPDAVGIPPGREGGAPWHRIGPPATAPPGTAWGTVAHPALASSRGLVVVDGPLARGAAGVDGDVVAAVRELAAGTGWPVLAGPRSGMAGPDDPGEGGAGDGGAGDGGSSGGGSSGGGATVVTAAELVVRTRAFAEAHRPDVIVRIGPPWASRPVNDYVASSAADGTTLVVVDPWERWTDPAGTAEVVVRAGVASWCRGLLAARADTPAGAGGSTGWASAWAAADAAARSVLDAELSDRSGPLTEPAVARRLTAALPEDGLLVVASSMPVRDVETFADRRRPLDVLANRGANGIDGVVSTALGAALGSGRSTVALVGDLAFLHDVSALVGLSGVAADLTVVVVDNGGGGIFSFLDQAGSVPPDVFERLFGTPTGDDVAAVARGFGCPVDEIDGEGSGGGGAAPGGFEDVLARHLALRRCSVIRVRVPDRAANLAHHRRLVSAVTAAVEAAGG